MQECRCSAIRDAFGIERPNDGRSRPDDVGHDGGLFLSVQFENGLALSDRDDEKVATAALFVSDQQGGGVVSIEDRVELLAARCSQNEQGLDGGSTKGICNLHRSHVAQPAFRDHSTLSRPSMI